MSVSIISPFMNRYRKQLGAPLLPVMDYLQKFGPCTKTMVRLATASAAHRQGIEEELIAEAQ
jgi:hypothetical protein